ncbi:hypothetical protein PspR76_15970 [Pseudomonas sp. R76]|nr:hypothetical protein PspR76_15970 [Pseudomonas sp. R76]
MQTPRSSRYTESMPSQASQLPHVIEFSFKAQVGCQAASAVLLIQPLRSATRPPCSAFDLDLRRPVKPRWPNAGFGAGVNRQDAGLAALGQGWPIAAAPAPKPSFGHTEPRRGAEWWGKSPLVTLGLFQSDPP